MAFIQQVGMGFCFGIGMILAAVVMKLFHVGFCG
jgi:hypothetical protein